MRAKFILIFLVVLMSFIGAISLETAAVQSPKTVYLVIGEDATLNGNPGQTVHNRFLQNTIVFQGLTGTTLPVPVSTRGLVFTGYVIGQNNELEFNTVVPENNHTILYALWQSANNPRKAEPVIDQDVNLFKADLYLSTAEGVFDPKYQFNFKSSDSDTSAVGFTEYYITVTVEAGFTFYLRSQNPLIQGVQATTYPTLASGKVGLGYSLPTGAGRLAPFRTIDYIEILGSTTVYNQTDFVFANGVAAGALRFKQSGTVRIYVVFYDQGGWVKFYAEPV